jgi:hypothetical protein
MIGLQQPAEKRAVPVQDRGIQKQKKHPQVLFF